MFRRALPVGLFALSALSQAALIVTIDPGQIAYRDPSAPSVFWVRGTLDCTAMGTTQPSSAKMASFSASGPGASFNTAAASVNGALVNGLTDGMFVGDLFSVRIPSDKPLGDYAGFVSLSLKFGRSTYSTQLAEVAFRLQDVPQPVPEPGLFAVLGLGVFVRRRRR